MKRTKLLASLMMCVMCLSFLIVGVWAAVVSVNFNLNAGLKYYPEGVYVELSGQVYRGSSADNLTALTYDPRFTLSPTTNYDNSTGEPSGNFPIESWEIGSIPFIPTEKFVKIEVTITNNSDFTIAGIPTITIDQKEMYEVEGITFTDNSAELFSISTGTSIAYELILEVTSTTEINSSLSVSFDFYSAEVNYAYFTINENNQITGLTETYLVDSPKLLVIPAYSESGNSLHITTSMASNLVSSIIVFSDIISFDYRSFMNKSTVEIVYFPEGFTSISGTEFNATPIKTAYFPSTLTSIGVSNFGSIRYAYFATLSSWNVISDSSGGHVTHTADEFSNPVNAANIVRGSNSYGMQRI